MRRDLPSVTSGGAPARRRRRPKVPRRHPTGARGNARAGCRRAVKATASARASPRTSSCTRSTGSRTTGCRSSGRASNPRKGGATTLAIEHYREVLDGRARAQASTRGSACTTSRCRAGSPRSAKATSSTNGPARTSGRATSRSARRRSVTSSTAGSRSTNPRRTRRMYRTGGRSPRSLDWGRSSTCSKACCSRSATRGASCAAVARRLRRSTTCRRSSKSVRQCRREQVALALEELTWKVWMRADRDGVLELPGRGAREVPDLREACDLVGFSYYSATGVDREGKVGPYPSDARVGPDGQRAVERRARHRPAPSARGVARPSPARLRARCRHRR